MANNPSILLRLTPPGLASDPGHPEKYAIRKTSSRLVWVGLAVALLALTGCPREPVYRTTSQTTLQSGGGGGTNLSGVESKLEQLDEWNLAAGSESIVSELNEWIRNARPVPDWRRDPLIDELPTEFEQLEAVRAVGGDEFQLSDVQFLAERRLLHATSDKIVADGISAGSDLFLSDEPLAETIASAPSSGRLERTPLEKTTLLFDWTIRNIVLQPMPPAPAAPTGDITGSGLAVLTRAPGAGYTLSLDQALLRGQGDAWMRLRTFVALCEQQGIRAVALGAPTGNRAEPQSPRLAGVLLDDQLLLFDLALGLPIPNGKGGVASFEELKADPSIWKSAVETAYGGEPRPRESAFIDPAKMVAYVAADPSSLSKRMATLEQEWSGAGRVRLTVQPSVIAAQLKEVAGIERTEIWNQPIESMIFESSIAEFARRGDPSVQEFLRVRQIFSPPTPIYYARKRYLTGPETVNGEPVTAIATLMKSSLTEAQLDEIETSREVQKMLGYDRVLAQIPDPQQKRLFLQQARQQFGIIKKLAKYYVGFAQYQIPDFEQAVRWFEDSAALSDEGIWRVGSYYNLGRSLEALGRYPAATALYRQDKSIQRPMSILRAAKLSERAGLAAADAPKEEASASEESALADPPAEEPPAEEAAASEDSASEDS
jgi:hypothetical protein